MERPIASIFAIWDSACGAVGTVSPLRGDLDEVADDLLAVLGPGGRVSETGGPVGDSGGMGMQHYDIPCSLRRLRHTLHGHGFALRTSTRGMPGQRKHSLWVRREGS